jgi:hypothetical protein
MQSLPTGINQSIALLCSQSDLSHDALLPMLEQEETSEILLALVNQGSLQFE